MSVTRGSGLGARSGRLDPRGNQDQLWQRSEDGRWRGRGRDGGIGDW